MTDTRQALADAARQSRKARGAFDRRLAQVRADLAARGPGGRLADSVTAEARRSARQALAVAAESRAIVAGTTGLLALWFLRRPIITWLDSTLSGLSGKTKDEQ